MQNCWAVQNCRMLFISQGPDTRTAGLKRTRCPSEVTNFSYLVCFTDQAGKVLIFCNQVICAPFPYIMLSDGLAQQETAEARCFHSPQQSLSSWTDQKTKQCIPRTCQKLSFFVCLFCVWPFGFISRIRGTGMRHKLFLWPSGCAIRTPWGGICSGRCASKS